MVQLMDSIADIFFPGFRVANTWSSLLFSTTQAMDTQAMDPCLFVLAHTRRQPVPVPVLPVCPEIAVKYVCQHEIRVLLSLRGRRYGTNNLEWHDNLSRCIITYSLIYKSILDMCIQCMTDVQLTITRAWYNRIQVVANKIVGGF